MRQVNPYDRFKLRVYDTKKKKYLNNDDINSKTGSCCGNARTSWSCFIKET